MAAKTLCFSVIWLGIHQLMPREFVLYTRQVFPNHKGRTVAFLFTLSYPVLPAAITESALDIFLVPLLPSKSGP